MTNEERQKLCDALRNTHPSRIMCKEAANEIERLAADVDYWQMIANRAYIDPKPLAQSDAEPVAWPDIDAAVKAGLATRNPAPDAAPSAYSNSKTVTIGDTTPPAPAQSNAEPSRDAILRRCERWLRHEVEATFQEESGYDLWEAIKAALTQPDAEPVAWRWRWRADPPNEWHFAFNEFHGEQIIIEPLYTAPPRPDAADRSEK